MIWGSFQTHVLFFNTGFSGSDPDQKKKIEKFGCSTPSKVELPGGLDTITAEEVMAGMCGLTKLTTSLLDHCGGHTKTYHNHERLICLYNENAGG